MAQIARHTRLDDQAQAAADLQAALAEVEANKARRAGENQAQSIEDQAARIAAVRTFQGRLAQSHLDAAQARQDEQLKAQADAASAAASEPPATVNVAPLPSGQGPAQIGSADMTDLTGNSFDPSQVQGGGQIQAATGGLGRAAPAAAPPAGGPPGGALYGQAMADATANAAPQTQVAMANGQQNFQYPGMIASVPTQNTVVTQKPGGLSAYEAAKLRIDAAKVNQSQQAGIKGFADSLGKGLGNWIFEQKQAGRPVSPQEFDGMVASSIAGITAATGMDASRYEGYLRGVAAASSSEAGNDADKANTDFYKEITNFNNSAPGTPERALHWQKIQDMMSANKLASQGTMQAALMAGRLGAKGDYDTYTRAMTGVNLTGAILDLVGNKPGLVGGGGQLSRLVTEKGGALVSIGQLLSDDKQAKLAQLAVDSLNSLRTMGKQQGIWSDEDDKTYAGTIQKLYDPEGFGKLDTLVYELSAIRAGLASAKPSIRGIEVYRKSLDQYALKNPEQFLSEVRTIQSGLQAKAHATGSQIDFILGNFPGAPDWRKGLAPELQSAAQSAAGPITSGGAAGLGTEPGPAPEGPDLPQGASLSE